ncbi:hypothetical protein BGZ65_000039 [Modicella reniformis]|uniref:Uncharacterized protein n=1 Tax=Modicella reniformis TaxID=1440133 RepID=A0A9P6SNF3_9FUNG|nr:hypothetical protein BGZ65_000039 [Modicella reniformis]
MSKVKTDTSRVAVDITTKQKPETNDDPPVPLNESEDKSFCTLVGPVARIARIKERLVIKRLDHCCSFQSGLCGLPNAFWTPGPEAAEICMFIFGYLVGGRLEGITELCFVILAALGGVYINASFRALHHVMAAMVLKAVFKVGEHTFVSNKTK